MRHILRVAAVLSLAAVLACASGSGSGSSQKPDKSKGGGFRVLDAVVVDRDAQHGYAGAMIYTMGFEAKDGEATSHMRYEVTKEQYQRFQEGARVKLYLADDRLRDIKSGD